MDKIKRFLNYLLKRSNHMEENACFLSGAFYSSLKEKSLLKEEPCNDLMTLCRKLYEDSERDRRMLLKLGDLLGFDIDFENSVNGFVKTGRPGY